MKTFTMKSTVKNVELEQHTSKHGTTYGNVRFVEMKGAKIMVCECDQCFHRRRKDLLYKFIASQGLEKEMMDFLLKYDKILVKDKGVQSIV